MVKALAQSTNNVEHNGCRSTVVLTGTSNNQVPFMKSGTWWSADITP